VSDPREDRTAAAPVAWSALRREVCWGALVLAPMPLLFVLTIVEGFMLRYPWFAGLFQLPSEDVLLPAWIGILFFVPLLLCVLIVWTWQIVRHCFGRSARAGPVSHLLAALPCAFAFFAAMDWPGAIAPEYLVSTLFESLALGFIFFGFLYWPRLVFRSLRAARASPAR